jgi:enterochelin esterase-like enzyme
VVVTWPTTTSDRERFPVLVALHGRGEALKGRERGARGWLDDYWLLRATRRLAAPPLTSRDLLGFGQPERLLRQNESLEREPYRGLVVVMPYTPDGLGGERRSGDPFASARRLASFVVDDVLPRVYRETPAIGSAASTGIDGVSLGGRGALLIGLERPKAFGAVGGLQAAIDANEIEVLVERASAAVQLNPRLVLRLLTSDDDYFLDVNRALSRALASAAIEHRLVVVPGPHDYAFNRGPGAYEMLLFHERVLRELPPP